LAEKRNGEIMKAPVERKLYPKGYYECSLCGHGVEIHVRMTDKPMCTKHGIMQLSKKPNGFGKESE
jgi:predicted nucleic acid-binding Zn ribbon protein